MIRLAVAGALGRTGRRVTEMALADPRFEVVAALGSTEGRQSGVEIRGGDRSIRVSEKLAGSCDVLVDFTLPAGTMAWLGECRRLGVAFVSGVTGLSGEQLKRIEESGRAIPVMHAANFSFGVTVVRSLLERLTRSLGDGYDVEVVETHHRHKVDAPSGTAMALVEVIARARGRSPEEVIIEGRSGHVGPRPGGQIGVHSVRMGEVVGRHVVSFSGPGETISVVHDAQSRDAFAAGALRAAAWLVGQPPGHYKVDDLLR